MLLHCPSMYHVWFKTTDAKGDKNRVYFRKINRVFGRKILKQYNFLKFQVASIEINFLLLKISESPAEPNREEFHWFFDPALSYHCLRMHHEWFKITDVFLQRVKKTAFISENNPIFLREILKIKNFWKCQMALIVIQFLRLKLSESPMEPC